MAAPQPNIVLIHCHDLGRYLGCYRNDIETPNIEDLADEGVLFEEHFGSAPQCSPSRGSLMTGRFPHVNGLMGLAHGKWELDESERVLPQYLEEAGYETHLFGLQHITQNTDRLGYDHIHSEANLYPGVSPAVHETNRAKTVASVVSTCLEQDDYSTPLFASVGFFEVHRDREDSGRFGFRGEEYDTDDPETVRPLSYLPDRRGIRYDLAEMHGMVYAIDDAVGTILDAIADAGLAEDTLVIFTTEHGIAFPRAKGSCYDAGIEAALLMRYPGLAEGGKRYDELISNVDVLPTILDIVGMETPDTLDGRSFRPLLADEESYRERERIFAEMTWHDMYNPVRAIRTERYKYIRSFWHLPKVYLPTDVFASESGREVRERYSVPTRPYEELYDLQETPQEDENVVHEPRHEDVRVNLSRRLHAWMEATDDPLLNGPVEPKNYDDILRWPHELSQE
jgi:N-sulfoglucosamine sulfohydrolase